MNALIEEAQTKEDIKEYLIFTVSSIDFGVDIGLVQEIIQLQPFFQIPNAVKSCKGIINMRGTIVPVIDMRLKLGYESCEYDEKTCIIVIMAEGELIGMIVDMVHDVCKIQEKDLTSSPTVSSDMKNSGHVQNIAVTDGKIRQILDIYSVFGIGK